MTIKNTIVAIAFAATIAMSSIASAQYGAPQQGPSAGQPQGGISGMFGPQAGQQISGQRPSAQQGYPGMNPGQQIGQRPQYPTNPQGMNQNSLEGAWYLSVQEDGGTIRARMTFDPSGQISFSLRANSPEGQQQMDINAQWRMQGTQLQIISDDGDVETMPYEFNQGRLVVPLATEGLTLGFVRNKEEARARSFVRPTEQQQQQPGYRPSSDGFDGDW